jgi:DNA polymerase III alpha subunit (gram-positive type)
MNKKILVFDVETTGLSPKSSQIIEFGAQLFSTENNKLELLKEVNFLVKAEQPLPAKIIEITNITDQMLAAEGISEEEAFNRINQLIDEETLLVAYNIAFDLSFMVSLFHKYHNIKYQVTNDILDVMALYKDRHSFPHRLESAVAKYQVNVVNTHRALDDVKATVAVLSAMKKEQANLKTYINVLGYHPTYGYSGPVLKHVKLIAQKGGLREIEKSQ